MNRPPAIRARGYARAGAVRTEPLLWLAASAAAVATLGISVSREVSSHRDAGHEAAALERTIEQVSEITALRAKPHASPPMERSGPLAQRVGEALAEAGLPSETLTQLAAESAGASSRHPSVEPVRRRATLTLSGLTLADLGRYLGLWREREPAWIVTGVEITPEHARDAAPGSDLPIRAVVRMETIAPRGEAQ